MLAEVTTAQDWIGAGVIAACLIFASTLHVLRGRREDQRNQHLGAPYVHTPARYSLRRGGRP